MDQITISPERIKEMLAGLQLLANNSNEYTSWALLIIGGSILAIVSTSYIRPVNEKIRLIYLLFLPGWASLIYSIYNGDLIIRNYISLTLLNRNADGFVNNLAGISYDINLFLESQLDSFRFGLGFFSLWLLLFLMWWVFGKWSVSTEK